MPQRGEAAISDSGGLGLGWGGASRRIDPADTAQLAESPVPAKRVLALFRGHGVQVVVLVATVVGSAVVGLAQPFLVRSIIDEALPRADRTLLLLDAAGLVVVAAGFAILGVAQTWLSTRMGNAVMHDLRVGTFEHLQRQSLAFFKRTRGERSPHASCRTSRGCRA